MMRLFRMYVHRRGENFEFVTMVIFCTVSVKQTRKLIFNILQVSSLQDLLSWKSMA